jgi:hypothetical protein
MVRLSAVLVLILASFSVKGQDTLFLNNKSVLVGKLKNIDLATVTFKANDITTLTLEIDKIKTLHVSSKLLRIETIFKQVHIGYLLSGQQPGTTRVASDHDTTEIYLTSIIGITTIGNTFWQATSGHIGAGYSYTRSSGIGRFNFDGNIKYVKEHIETSMGGSAIMTQENEVLSRDREEFTAQASYYYSPIWYNQLFVNYQRNLELSLSRRLQQGIGFGSRFLMRSNMQANLVTGFVINQETSTEGKSSGTLSEVPIGIQYNFYKFSKPKFILSISQIAYLGVNQNGRVRQDGKTKLTWKPFSDFSLAADLYNNYDSNPPGGNSASFDYGIVFTVGYDF